MILLNKLVVKNGVMISTPIKRIRWDGRYKTLKEIISKNFLVGKKLQPFTIKNDENVLVFSKTLIHPQCDKSHMFFVFKEQKLVRSANNLSGLFA